MTRKRREESPVVEAPPSLEPKTRAARIRAAEEAHRKAEREKQRRAEQRRLRSMLACERGWIEQGCLRIAGVDEVGVGPLAGPVVAAAVILPARRAIPGADDSKALSAEQREALEREIRASALASGIGVASVDEIARWNIYQAGLLAMRRALDALEEAPDLVLVDARTLPHLPWRQEAHIRGDARVHCIACASILAKVYRDARMIEYDRLYPGYGFAHHKGYATLEHRTALERLGPSPIHRRGYHGVSQMELFPARCTP